MIERPRGTRDFLPEDMALRREIESAMRRTALAFGYGEVQTPTFESTDLFVAKSGEAIVEEIYVFEDKGGRSLSLRPELTAAVMRLYASTLTHSPKPVRVFYMGPCFRYERPQKGRYREFFQFGAELIGTPQPEGDAEIIALAVRAIQSAGLADAKVRVGHVGAMRGLLEAKGVSPSVASAAFPLIDKGDYEGLRDLLTEHVDHATVDLVEDYVSMTGDADVVVRAQEALAAFPVVVEHLERLVEALGHLDGYEGIEYTVDLGIARGLDYYTGIVFEVDWDDLGAEKQVCGGGAYTLGQLFGLDDVPATGFAIGLDRVGLASEMLRSGDELPDRSGAIVVPMDRSRDVMALATRAMETLRSGGIRTELEVMRRNTGKVLKGADARRLRWAVIVGTDEVDQGKVALKDLESGDQRLVGPNELGSLE
jgi:histidyl-tRNA synthetase